MKAEEIKSFSFSIGGYPGPFFHFALEQETLSCEFSPDENTPSQVITFSVACNEKWNQLVSYLSSKKWKAEYDDNLICDGTSWQLTFLTEKHTIKSEGRNGYPPGFQKFIRLLNAITSEKGLTVY